MGSMDEFAERLGVTLSQAEVGQVAKDRAAVKDAHDDIFAAHCGYDGHADVH